MPLSHTSRFSEPTDAQYAALGRAMVEWGNVEQLLGMLLSRLLATPDFLARTYTASMSAVRIQEAVAEAVEIHKVRYRHRVVRKEVLADVLKVNGEVSELRGKRNKIAHFCGSRQDDETLFGTSFPGGVPSPKKDRREYETLTLAELSKLNARAHAQVERLIEIVSRLPEVTEESLLAHPSSGLPTAAAHVNR